MRGPITAVLGALTVALAVAGCSQTSSGTPTSQPATSSGPSTSHRSAPSDPPTSAGGGQFADSKMCQDFRDAGGRINDVQSGDKYGVRLWRKLAADAPPPIKPDAQLIAKFVADAAAGHPDVTNVSKAMTALGKVSDWATKNCI